MEKKTYLSFHFLELNDGKNSMRLEQREKNWTRVVLFAVGEVKYIITAEHHRHHHHHTILFSFFFFLPSHHYHHLVFYGKRQKNLKSGTSSLENEMSLKAENRMMRFFLVFSFVFPFPSSAFAFIHFLIG